MALQLTSRTVERAAVITNVEIHMTVSQPTESDAAEPERIVVEQPSHPWASISGLLENHPLRDRYLEALKVTE